MDHGQVSNARDISGGAVRMSGLGRGPHCRTSFQSECRLWLLWVDVPEDVKYGLGVLEKGQSWGGRFQSCFMKIMVF